MLGKEISYFVKLLASFIVSVLVLEILVRSIVLILICVSVLGISEYSKSHFLVSFIRIYAGEKLHG